jgi:hypothetical protein
MSPVNAGQPFGVYTYPSLHRHEKRFWNNTRFLYEKTQTKAGTGDLECLYDAVRTLPYSMPYYQYHVKADTKILTNMKNVPDDIGIVLFSHFLTQESELLPSGGYTSPVLFLSSLLKKMCPKILIRTGYDRQSPKEYYDYVMFQYEK